MQLLEPENENQTWDKFKAASVAFFVLLKLNLSLDFFGKITKTQAQEIV